MRRLVSSVMIVGAALALGASLDAAGGLTIVTKMSGNGDNGTARIQLDAQHMRAEGSGQSGEKQLMIFDGAKQVMDIVNLDRKTYSEMTKADVDRIAGQMGDAMAQMKAQIANLPPDQRARVEAMMRGRMGGAGAAAPVKPEFRKTGTDTVGKWTCDKYEGYQSGQKVSEVCTVDPKVLGFTAADFQVTREMADFFGRLIPGGAAQMFAIGSLEAQGYSGVPVRQLTFSNGQQTMSMEVTDVSRGSIPDAAFTVPAGFEKRDFMGGRGRGRGGL